MSSWKDRVLGAFIGLFLGDSLGGPFEFHSSISIGKYTGLHEFPTTTQFQFQKRKSSAIGQVTDDSCFSIALAGAIFKHRAPTQDQIITEYLELCNGPLQFLGRNTRTLFKGVKTISGYRSRYLKMLENEVSQSNGSLMRIMPAILLFHIYAIHDILNWAVTDTYITNPCEVNREATIIYITLFYLIYTGQELTLQNIRNVYTPQQEQIIRAIDEGMSAATRNIKGKEKGWVCHTLYCVFRAVTSVQRGQNFEECLKEILQLGGDTDTNMAVAGAFLGAYLGKDQLLSSARTAHNLQVVLSCDTSRGEFSMRDTNGVELYHPRSMIDMLEKL